VSFSSLKELQPYSVKVFQILNDAFQFLPYVSHLNDKMIRQYADKYFKILNPRFIKVVVKDDQPIGFFVGLPSLSKAMQKTKGRLFPFGIIHILRALKKPEVIDMLLTGVLQDFQNAGIAVILISELQQEMVKAGVNTLETTGIFETNQNVIANWKNYEHIQHKRRRCFVKSI
jgi:GNAT superfamily N-acetyltransferase